MEKEIWKPIKGYDGVYDVSSYGNVRRNAHILNSERYNGTKYVTQLPERMLNPTDNGRGYLIVGLSKNKQRKNMYIHRLVAEAFIGEISLGMVINHKDFNKKNNNVENLEIVTQLKNCEWSYEHYCKPKNFYKKSGYKHIRFRNGKYAVEVTYHTKFYYGGTYLLLKDALKRREQIYEQINYYR